MNRNNWFIVSIVILIGMLLSCRTGTIDPSGNANTSTIVQTTHPTVTSTTPANNSINIAVNSTIVANFSVAMDPATLTASTFHVSGPSGNITGTVTPNSATATFTSTGNLSIGTVYTACITSAATDVAGNPLASNYCWSFTTVGGGLSWTAQSSPTTANLNGVVYNGSRYVAVGDGGVIVTSTNGTTWSLASSSPTTDDLFDVTWTGTQFIAVGGMQNASTTILTSTDGDIWTTPTTLPSLSQPLNAVASASTNTLVAVGPVGQIAMVSGDGGNIWSQVTITTAASWDLDDILWTGSQFVAVGVSGTVRTSPDGLTWTDHSTGTNFIYKSVAYSGTRYVAVGNSYVSTSTNAATWTAQGVVIPADLTSVVWTGSRFIAVGVYTAGTNVGYITSSSDGTTWQPVTVPTLDWLIKVALGPAGTVVAVGRNGEIVTSP